MLLLLGLICIGAGWLLPWHFAPWQTFQQEAVAAFGTGLVALGAVQAASRNGGRLPRLALLGLLLGVLPWVQWAAGQVVYLVDALLCSAYLLAAAMALWAGFTLARGTRRAEWVAGWFATVAVAAIASVAIGLVQWLDFGAVGYVADLLPGSRIYANLTQPNHFATLLGMGVVAFAWAYETRRIGGATAALAVAFLGFGMAMAQSRAGWLFLAALAVWLLAMRGRLALRTRPLAVAAMAGLVVVWVRVFALASDLLLVAPGPDFGSRLQAGTRVVHWATIWEAIWLKPWAGYGWGQVTLAQEATAANHPTTAEWLLYSHNIVLDLLAWNGVVVGTFIVLALAWWGLRRVRRCDSIDGWAMLAASGAITTHALLEYPHAYAFFLLPLALMLGSAEGLERAVSEPHVRRAFTPRLAGAVVAVQLAVLGWIGFEYVQVETAARELRLQMMGVVVPGGVKEPPPDVRLLDQPREFHRFWITEARPGMSADELDWMRDVVRRRPIAPALMRYALACALNGRPADATNALLLIRPLWGDGLSREGRENWAKLEAQYPQLAAVPFPGSPAELAAPPSSRRASAL